MAQYDKEIAVGLGILLLGFIAYSNSQTTAPVPSGEGGGFGGGPVGSVDVEMAESREDPSAPGGGPPGAPGGASPPKPMRSVPDTSQGHSPDPAGGGDPSASSARNMHSTVHKIMQGAESALRAAKSQRLSANEVPKVRSLMAHAQATVDAIQGDGGSQLYGSQFQRHAMIAQLDKAIAGLSEIINTYKPIQIRPNNKSVALYQHIEHVHHHHVAEQTNRESGHNREMDFTPADDSENDKISFRRNNPISASFTQYRGDDPETSSDDGDWVGDSNWRSEAGSVRSAFSTLDDQGVQLSFDGAVDNSPENLQWGSLQTRSVVNAADPTWDAVERAEEKPLLPPVRGAFSDNQVSKEVFRESEDREMTKTMGETVAANVGNTLGGDDVQAAADSFGISEDQAHDNAVVVPTQSQVAGVVTTDKDIFNVAPVNRAEQPNSISDQAATLLAAGNSKSKPQRARPVEMITLPSQTSMFNASKARPKRPAADLYKPPQAKRGKIESATLRQADSDDVLRNAFNSAGGSNPQRLPENPAGVEESLLSAPWTAERGKHYQQELLRTFLASEGADKVSAIAQRTKYLYSQVPDALRVEPFNIKSYFDIERKLYENPRNAEDYAAASPEYVFWVQLCKTARDRRNEAMSIAGRKRKTEDFRIEMLKRPDMFPPESSSGKRALDAYVKSELDKVDDEIRAEVVGGGIKKARTVPGYQTEVSGRFRDFPDPRRERSPSAPPADYSGGFGPLEKPRGALSPTPETMAGGQLSGGY